MMSTEQLLLRNQDSSKKKKRKKETKIHSQCTRSGYRSVSAEMLLSIFTRAIRSQLPNSAAS